jgi:hypothetical protein
MADMTLRLHSAAIWTGKLLHWYKRSKFQILTIPLVNGVIVTQQFPGKEAFLFLPTGFSNWL